MRTKDYLQIKGELIGILPFVPAYLITISALKLIWYYKLFDIDIVEYIEISEILILSLNEVSLLIGFAFVYLYSYTFRNEKDTEDSKVTVESRYMLTKFLNQSTKKLIHFLIVTLVLL